MIFFIVILYLPFLNKLKTNLFLDLDECKTGRHDCDPNAKCKNLPKRGYECHCKPGFKQYNNGRVCQGTQLYF